MTEPIISLPGLSAKRAPVGAQWLLHGHPHDAAALAAATGLRLPTTLLTAAEAGGWTALHLSPDEWLLVAADGGGGAALADRLAASGIACSLVDVSDRSLAIELEGTLAADALAGACPLDLERLPGGCCTRTLFGKVTVLLHRTGERWRLDYPRSLDGYVTALLGAVGQDAAEAAANA